MVNSGNPRDKKEHFTIINDVLANPMLIAIVIGVIILIGVVIFLLMSHKSQASIGMMDYMTDISPMAPLTQTPQM
jgi:hypothetical protein